VRPGDTELDEVRARLHARAGYQPKGRASKMDPSSTRPNAR
jgi:hypothetical protein